MLSAEQREIRRTGIGASEIGAIAGLNPWRGPIDVWMKKPTPTRGPLDESDEEEGLELDLADKSTLRKRVGDYLEDGLRGLYSELTGVEMRRSGETLRHPRYPHILASPDGLPVDDDPELPGLEIKIVGSRVAHHWDGNSLPDYVRAQAAQNMAVANRWRWDVIALVGGTEPRLVRLERDEDLEDSLIEAGDVFWRDYVLADVCPEPRDEDERARYLRARYPGSESTACRALDDDETRVLVSELETVRAEKKLVEEREKLLTSLLCERVGDDYGVQGAWGKFLWIPKRGQVSWKAVAESLASGAIPDETVERYRGEPFRSPALYMAKAKAEKRSGR